MSLYSPGTSKRNQERIFSHYIRSLFPVWSVSWSSFVIFSCFAKHRGKHRIIDRLIIPKMTHELHGSLLINVATFLPWWFRNAFYIQWEHSCFSDSQKMHQAQNAWSKMARDSSKWKSDFLLSGCPDLKSRRDEQESEKAVENRAFGSPRPAMLPRSLTYMIHFL